MGSSTPLYMVFYKETNRDKLFPYYIQKYGYYYGYQHTSTSTLILDGGLLLFIIVVAFILLNLIQSIMQTNKDITNKKSFIKFGILIYLLYFFTYANVLKDFRTMAILGLVLSLNTYKKSINDNDRHQSHRHHHSQIRHDPTYIHVRRFSFSDVPLQQAGKAFPLLPLLLLYF